MICPIFQSKEIQLLGVFAVFLGISTLIALHEWGHYAVARLCGMDVRQFSIGFGPPLLRWRWGSTEFQLAMIPLGGYVQIAGLGEEDPLGTTQSQSPPSPPTLDAPTSTQPQQVFNSAMDQANAPSTPSPPRPISFEQAPLWQRFAVIAAGPLTNGFLTFCLLIPVAWQMGLPDRSVQLPIVGQVQADSPAARSQIQTHDRILAVNQHKIKRWDELLGAIATLPVDKPALLEIQRGELAPFQVQIYPIRPEGSTRPILGITMGHGPRQPAAHLGQAVHMAWLQAWQAASEQAQGLWGMITGRQQGQLTGLPGIAKLLHRQVQQSLLLLFESLATISMSLCLLNLLPIPALDGARLAVLGAEAISRRKVPARIEAVAHQLGMLALLALMIFVSLRDIWRW